MNYISLDNLTRYHSKFKDYADAKYALTKGSLWKQTEKAGAVTCWPIGESRMKPVVEFLFKETLPVGDKSSSNPSTITGVTQAKVTRCGKNLITFPYYSQTGTDSHNITWTVNADGSVTASGTANGISQFHLVKPYWENGGGRLLQAGSYKLSGCASGGGGNTYKVRVLSFSANAGYISAPSDTGSGSTVSITKPIIISFCIEINNGTTVSNLVFRPQLELGSAATAFELYEGVDYTVNLNGAYYGGSIDVTTGKLTVTHRMIEVGSLTLDISNYPAYLPLECTDTFGRTITSTGNILALTGSTGGKIVYKLANPYTVQIDPVVITSLPQIDKYTPRLNTLYTDAENITVKYIKSPIRDEYEKVQAIIANGGTI